MRAAIVGCGRVADKHARQIQRIPGAQIVGVCDREEMMAAQLAERFAVSYYGSDLGNLLDSCRPDVVHITTPPKSHYSVAVDCIQAGCHVYVEKPFTLRSAEAERLVEMASSRGLKLTVGHETQFSPVACMMRRLIRRGHLGGPPVHMESVYCYDLGDERAASALLGDENHWIRRLPGGLLHNVISHGIGKIAEYLQADDVEVWAVGRTSQFLQRLGEHRVRDEARAILVDSAGTTAYFTFSCQIRPSLHQFCVYGPKTSLVADHEHQTLVSFPENQRSYLNQVIPPLRSARELRRNAWRNVRQLVGRQLDAESGIYRLVRTFYEAVEGNCELPIPCAHILRTSRITDSIVAKIKYEDAKRAR